jgi:hypothetical protein
MQEDRKGSAAGEVKSLAGNLSKEILCLQEEYERACLSISETNSQMESLQKDVIALRSELERKENVIEELNKRLAESIENSPTARGQIGKQGVGAQGFGDSDDKASGAARVLEKTRRRLARLANQISAGVDTAVLNKADLLRTERNYQALRELEKTIAGDEDNSLGGRLALIEMDDTAMEAMLGKVRTTAEQKTGKHYEFTTEETLLRHVLNILEVTVPSREVLLGALVENTI